MITNLLEQIKTFYTGTFEEINKVNYLFYNIFYYSELFSCIDFVTDLKQGEFNGIAFFTAVDFSFRFANTITNILYPPILKDQSNINPYTLKSPGLIGTIKEIMQQYYKK